jgi:arylsulfatase A
VPVTLTATSDSRPDLDGRSFAPQLRGETGRPREWVFCQLNANRYVREQRWRLHDDGRLFDMQNDPFEQAPISPSDPHTPEATSARARLEAVLVNLQ